MRDAASGPETKPFIPACELTGLCTALPEVRKVPYRELWMYLSFALH